MMTEDYDGYLNKLSLDVKKAYNQLLEAGLSLRKIRKALSKKLEKELNP